jgi:hypothetical protein
MVNCKNLPMMIERGEGMVYKNCQETMAMPLLFIKKMLSVRHFPAYILHKNHWWHTQDLSGANSLFSTEAASWLGPSRFSVMYCHYF